MKVSYNKLQSYIEDTLPSPEVVADTLSLHFAEVEGIEKSEDDAILDIKILPDRSAYAKSYEGIAMEVAAALGLNRKEALKPKVEYDRTITLNPDRIREVLAIDITNDEMISLLGRLDIRTEIAPEALILSIPANRPDLQDWRDIPEEIGRIYGYDKIPVKIPEPRAVDTKPDKLFYYSEKIKNILTDLGFSEVYTYSLTAEGEYHIEKSVASDKNYLRTALSDGIQKSLELNAHNADLLGLDEIQVFEIGKVFPKEGERTSLAVGIKNVKKKKEAGSREKEVIKRVRDEVLKIIDANATILCTVDDTGGLISIGGTVIGHTNKIDGVFELDLDALVATLPEPASYTDLNFTKAVEISYKKFSSYPFIVRDIAVFVPESVTADDVWSAIEKGIFDAGGIDLLARHSLFDTFKKEGKVSYAFRMVFQSMEKTLKDDEANKIMEGVNKEVKGKGWEVR